MIEWTKAVGDWVTWLAAAGRPRTTRQLRRHQLMRLAGDMRRGPWAVTGEDLAGWLAGHTWSAETLRSHAAAVRLFYGWALRTGRVSADPTVLLPRVSPGSHAPRPAPEQAVSDGLRAPDSRVRLMVALAARQGLRRGEIARLHTDDVARDLVGWSLRVRGKGQRDRVIPLADDLARQLLAHPAGWVFPGRDGGHLSPAWVGRLVSRALPGVWTCHTLRHRFGTATYAGSRDLLAVQALLGHAKPETTLRYVRPPADAMREALRHAA